MSNPFESKTWGDSPQESMIDSYLQLEEESVAEAAKAEVEHITQLTGESEATMDPTLSPSLNRVV
jgi:hypothetical protein